MNLTDTYVRGAKRLGAQMIELSLYDLAYRNTFGTEESRLEYETRRIEAKDWFDERSDKPMGYLWCLSVTSWNGALIKRVVDSLFYKNMTIKQLQAKVGA